MADPKNKLAKSTPSLVEPSQTTEDLTPLAAGLAADREAYRTAMSSPFPAPGKQRVFAVSNQKGGVGKTTTAVNIAAALAKGGLRVLVIDSDPQGNASTALGVDHHTGTPSLYHVLRGEATIADVVQKCPDVDNLELVPSTIDLSSVEIELVTADRREYKLRDALEAQSIEHGRTSHSSGSYDYVIIDCPPSLGMLTLNALAAAREVLIPIQTEYYALEGLTQLMTTIQSVKSVYNPALEITTILLTMFDKRTNLSQDVAAEVRSYFGKQTLKQEIPRNVRISEAPSFQQTVVTYDPRSSGAVAYLVAARELAERGIAQS